MLSFIFKKCESDNNYLNKSFDTGATYEGVLKDDCSIERPVLEIFSTDAIIEYNYVVIPKFNRAYFVKDSTIKENGHYEISCEVDVLETYKSLITSNPCIIRSTEQYGYNNYIRHESFINTVKHKTDIIPFTYGLNDSGEFILITAGG